MRIGFMQHPISHPPPLELSHKRGVALGSPVMNPPEAVERLMAWLHHFRRIVTRWEVRVENYLGFAHWSCVRILFRQPWLEG